MNLKRLSSDDLRDLLGKNVQAMNQLTEQNTDIVNLLKKRGLHAVDPAGDDISIHPCIMQLDKLQSEPKPLTADELKAGGWWCGDVSKDCRLVFVEKGLDTWSDPWLDRTEFDRFYLAGTIVFRSTAVIVGLKQIHRIGNEFYWGASA